MRPPAQIHSLYPAWPAPVDAPLVTVDDNPCAYLSGRTTRTRMMLVRRMPPELYQRFMDSGFRRSGCIIYQPVCAGCRACVPIRVLVGQFVPGKSHRRCQRRNADLKIEIAPPRATDEKFDLYCRYLRDWHGRDAEETSRDGFDAFLYESPVDTIEFTYRDPSGRLLAVGICDLSPGSLSSVYCYFDPSDCRRGLGTYAALCEINFAAVRGIRYYYLGYWVEGCSTMDYKSGFEPNQKLGTDGIWRESAVVCEAMPVRGYNGRS